jgi:homoserine O-succinyltransferase
MNLAPERPYLRGFSDDFVMPVSRWTEMRRDEIEAAGLPVLLHSDEVGPALVEDPGHRALYIFNHLEYDSGTLNEEYRRDLMARRWTAPRSDAGQLLPRRRSRAQAARTAGAATPICSTATGCRRCT